MLKHLSVVYNSAFADILSETARLQFFMEERLFRIHCKAAFSRIQGSRTTFHYVQITVHVILSYLSDAVNQLL